MEVLLQAQAGMRLDGDSAPLDPSAVRGFKGILRLLWSGVEVLAIDNAYSSRVK